MVKNFIISGTGGQGVLSLGVILSNIFMLSDNFVSFCPSYGAEMRGGAVNCEVNMSQNSEILCPKNDKADFVIALNQTSFDEFISKVKKNGTIIVNSSLAQITKTRDDIKYVFAPLSQEALKLGNIKMTNSIALGVLAKIINMNIENVKKAYEKILKNKTELIQKNIEAYLLGYNYIQEKECV